MAITVDFVCLYRTKPPNAVRSMLTSHLGCPINFPGAQPRPAVNSFVSLALRRTTTGPQETGVAMEDALVKGKPFLGWLKKGEDKDELERKLEIGSQFMGVISNSETFYWEKGGGVCSRGKVVIIQFLPRDSGIMEREKVRQEY